MSRARFKSDPASNTRFPRSLPRSGRLAGRLGARRSFRLPRLAFSRLEACRQDGIEHVALWVNRAMLRALAERTDTQFAVARFREPVAQLFDPAPSARTASDLMSHELAFSSKSGRCSTLISSGDLSVLGSSRRPATPGPGRATQEPRSRSGPPLPPGRCGSRSPQRPVGSCAGRALRWCSPRWKATAGTAWQRPRR